MDKKILIVVIIVAILAVSSIAAYVVLSGDGGSNGSAENGGTTENGSTDNGSTENGATDNGNGENGGGTEVDVGGASSMQFKVSVDPADEESVTYEYMIKNAGTSSLMMRIEMESADEEFIYIINGAQEKVWICSDGEWMEISELYQTYWETWNTAWQGYQTSLLDWTGFGDWSYTTANGDSVRIYDINVNPSLSDSLFQH
ncbi:MAG: hypothetical protein PVH73_02180 [Candidatus Bathyarchaeota archaeon]|jgi:hypothetical protein